MCRTFRLAGLFVLGLSLCVFAGGVSAQGQPAQTTFEPEVGQPGKDVIWVPTPSALVNKMLEIANVSAEDYVIDLGSGDGRTVIAAAKRGARALGIEYNADMVELSKSRAAKEGVADRAQFLAADIFESDFSKATVITMFLLPDINLKLRPKMLDLKPGTRIVSNTFTMGEWASDESATVESGEYDDEDTFGSYRTALLWIVPAKVAGTWKVGQDELVLTQNFQMIEGTLKNGSSNTVIEKGRLRGDEIRFTAGDSEYSGRVNGDKIQGQVTTNGIPNAWTATRVSQ